MGIKVTIKFIYYWPTALLGEEPSTIKNLILKVRSMFFMSENVFQSSPMIWWPKDANLVYSIKFWSMPISIFIPKYRPYVQTIEKAPKIRRCSLHQVVRQDRVASSQKNWCILSKCCFCVKLNMNKKCKDFYAKVPIMTRRFLRKQFCRRWHLAVLQ